MSYRKKLDSSYRTIGILIFFSFWPILFNESIFGDSILNYELIQNGYRSRLFSYHTNYGQPIYGLIYYVLSYLQPIILVHKIVAVLAIIFAGYYTYAVLDQSEVFSRPASLSITLISLLFPLYSMWHEMTVLGYALSYVSLFAGVYYYWRIRTDQMNTFKIIVPVLLWAVAFELSSTIILFYLLIGLIALLDQKSSEKLRMAAISGFLRKEWYVLLYPIVYFLIGHVFLSQPTYEYNAIKFDLHRIIDNGIISAYGILVEPWVYFTHFIINNPITTIVLTLNCVMITVFAYKMILESIDHIENKVIQHSKILIFCIIWILACVMPYIIVGKPLRGYGYESRHTLLVLLPCSILIFTALHYLCKNNQKRLYLLTSCVLYICLIMQLSNHVLWQNRYIKYAALSAELSHIPQPSNRLIYLTDKAPIGTRHKLRSIELHHYVKNAWKSNQYFVYSLNKDYTHLIRKLYAPPRQPLQVFRQPWLMDLDMSVAKKPDNQVKSDVIAIKNRMHFNKVHRIMNDVGAYTLPYEPYDGRQAEMFTHITIDRSDNYEEGYIFWTYLWSKLTGDEDFLMSILDIKLTQISFD